jgi:N-acetyl-anhydromuramyl-L-alanine amidase AmpD
LNDPFFQTLKEDVHEKAFTETFLKSNVANANGMHLFDWKSLNESDCYYYMGKNLYEDYKKQHGDGAHISIKMFSQQLKDIGYVKAQKRLKNTKQADVMWVGFKRKRSA